MSKSLKRPCSQWSGELVTNRAENKNIKYSNLLAVLLSIRKRSELKKKQTSQGCRAQKTCPVRRRLCLVQQNKAWDIIQWFLTIIYVPNTTQRGKQLPELKDITEHTNAMAVYAVINKFKLVTRFLNYIEVQVWDCFLRRIVRGVEGRSILFVKWLIILCKGLKCSCLQ